MFSIFRLEGSEDRRPMTPRNITTLRVKSDTGNHTYILKMKFQETIRDLRKYIDLHRYRNIHSFHKEKLFCKVRFKISVMNVYTLTDIDFFCLKVDVILRFLCWNQMLNFWVYLLLTDSPLWFWLTGLQTLSPITSCRPTQARFLMTRRSRY